MLPGPINNSITLTTKKYIKFKFIFKIFLYINFHNLILVLKWIVLQVSSTAISSNSQ